MIRVLLADQALIRAGFRSILVTADGIEVVGEAADGDEAIRETRTHRPDIVLMDIRMPHTDGLQATRAICADPALAATRVIILTTYEADDFVYEALRAGASGFLVKDIEPADLFAAVRVVAAGDALLSPRITRRLIADIATRPDRKTTTAPSLAELTEREREVMTLVAAGLSNVEIADRLRLSPHTVKTHVNRAMTKLHARDRAQLVVVAYESRLVEPGQRPSGQPE